MNTCTEAEPAWPWWLVLIVAFVVCTTLLGIVRLIVFASVPEVHDDDTVDWDDRPDGWNS